MQPALKRPVVLRSAIVLCSALVVLLGAYGANQLSAHMMSPVALVGAWMMLALVLCYLVVRFQPSVGVPMFVGFGASALVVAVLAGMTMIH
jgi:hypothetical protein